MSSSSGNVEYANWWSKLLFKKSFENQFNIPVTPWVLEVLLNTIEKTFFRPDLSSLKIEKPIFIVGLPRSGTTLLYNLFCAHQDAAFITNSMNSFPNAMCSIEYLRKKLNLNIRGERFLADSIDTDFASASEPTLLWGKWMGRDVDSLHWKTQRIGDLPAGKPDEIYRDVKTILHCFGGQGKRFITKYPVMQTELEIVQDLFPDAKIIHIIRDGRQVANSLVKLHKLINDQLVRIKHPNVKYLIPYPRVENLKKYVEEFGATDIRCTANVWQDSISVVEKAKPHLKNFREVRYEDILANPSGEIRKLFDFTELAWPGPENAPFFKEIAGVGVVRHKNQYGQYDVVEQIAGPTLKAFGYLQ